MSGSPFLAFGEPWFLALLALVPLALAWGARRRRRTRVLFPDVGFVRGLRRGWRQRLRHLPIVLEGVALAGMIGALARPLAGKEEVLLESEGIDIVLVVDRSGSMGFKDMAEETSRIAVVKEVVGRFVAERTRDRLALVTFAHFADLRCPPTLDGEALRGFLEPVEPAKPGEDDGTAIGTGLARAVELLRGSSAKSRVVVLLTDGENNVHDIAPLEAAQFAKAEGVRVYTIAAGRYVFWWDPFRRGYVPLEEEIDTRELGDTSMMPDDQLKQFAPQEIAGLFAYLRGKAQVPMLATKDVAGLLFNGRDLTGWTGDPKLWSVEDGEIVGRSPGLTHNSFLVSDITAENFRLSLDVKHVNNEENSGVQFRSQPLHGYEELKGYQADIGHGWWGKLYEENGRAMLWDKPGDVHVKTGDWNHYEIEAIDGHVRTWINGQPCVDLDDPQGSRRGVFALQIHAGGPMEVRFRNLKLEVK